MRRIKSGKSWKNPQVNTVKKSHRTDLSRPPQLTPRNRPGGLKHPREPGTRSCPTTAEPCMLTMALASRYLEKNERMDAQERCFFEPHKPCDSHKKLGIGRCRPTFEKLWRHANGSKKFGCISTGSLVFAKKQRRRS